MDSTPFKFVKGIDLTNAAAKKLLYCHSGEPIFYFDKDGNLVIPTAQVANIFRIAAVIAGYAKEQGLIQP